MIKPRVEVLNLTPHPINVILDGDVRKKIEIPTSGYTIRLKTDEIPIGIIQTQYGDIPIVDVIYGIPQLIKDGTPLDENASSMILRKKGVIVSSVIASSSVALEWLKQKDVMAVYIPNTSKAIRDKNGQIIGVPNLIEVYP